MEGFLSLFVEWFLNKPQEARDQYSPLALYTEFLKIHPFLDGNGRVAYLLWATAMFAQDDEWPIDIPPDVFGNGDSSA